MRTVQGQLGLLRHGYSALSPYLGLLLCVDPQLHGFQVVAGNQTFLHRKGSVSTCGRAVHGKAPTTAPAYLAIEHDRGPVVTALLQNKDNVSWHDPELLRRLGHKAKQHAVGLPLQSPAEHGQLLRLATHARRAPSSCSMTTDAGEAATPCRPPRQLLHDHAVQNPPAAAP